MCLKVEAAGWLYGSRVAWEACVAPGPIVKRCGCQGGYSLAQVAWKRDSNCQGVGEPLGTTVFFVLFCFQSMHKNWQGRWLNCRVPRAPLRLCETSFFFPSLQGPRFLFRGPLDEGCPRPVFRGGREILYCFCLLSRIGKQV